MDDGLNFDNISDGIVLGDSGLKYLNQAAKWARFLAIVGFIMIGLLLLLAVGLGLFVAAIQESSEDQILGGADGAVAFFVYGLMALIYFFPTLYLYRFASRSQKAIRSRDSHLLEDGFENLTSCFRFIGILTIIVLVLYLFGFGLVVLIGLSGAF